MKRLRELLQAATPGIWEDFIQNGKYRLYEFGADKFFGDNLSPQDAQLIVAIRNCLPELLDVVEAVQSTHRIDPGALSVRATRALVALDKKLEGV